MLPKNFFHRKRTVLINILYFPWKKIFSQYTEIHSPAAIMFLVRLLDKNIFLQIVEDCIDDGQGVQVYSGRFPGTENHSSGRYLMQNRYVFIGI